MRPGGGRPFDDKADLMTSPAPFQRPRGKVGVAVDKYKGWPKWAQIAAPITALALIGGAAGGGDEAPEREEAAEVVEDTTTTTEDVVTLDDAVDAASDGAPEGVTDDELGDLIDSTCAGLATGALETAAADVATDVVDNSSTTDDQVQLVEAVGDGAEVLCPDDVATAPRFLGDIARLAGEQSAPTTAPPTTAPPTTAAPVTAPPTTAPPATSPPPTAPPPTSPPATSGVYYANCDEARAAGAAPIRRGEPGYRSALDRDDDGIACDS